MEHLQRTAGNRATARFLRSHSDWHAVTAAGSAPFGLLRRQPEEKPEPEQPPSKEPTSNAPEQPAVKGAPVENPCTVRLPDLPVLKAAEQKQRDAILQDMMRGLTANEKADACKRNRRALAAFSTNQMLLMKKAGVRFWRFGELPPPLNDQFATGKSSRRALARYHPHFRVIDWKPGAGVDEIRHELAHAWDHVRTGNVKRLDALKGKQLETAVLTTPSLSSETSEKRVTITETVGGKTTKVKLSVRDAFDRFMKRPASSYWSFANTKTDPEHVTSDVVEFYAEGYSVFHGGNVDAQAQLLCDAPELYQLLETEAQGQKLSVPDRVKLDRNNQDNHRKCAP